MMSNWQDQHLVPLLFLRILPICLGATCDESWSERPKAFVMLCWNSGICISVSLEGCKKKRLDSRSHRDMMSLLQKSSSEHPGTPPNSLSQNLLFLVRTGSNWGQNLWHQFLRNLFHSFGQKFQRWRSYILTRWTVIISSRPQQLTLSCPKSNCK